MLHWTSALLPLLPLALPLDLRFTGIIPILNIITLLNMLNNFTAEFTFLEAECLI